MNEQQLTLIHTVMDMISGTLDTYDADPHHAPARWLLENWWATLNGVLQIGYQDDSAASNVDPADHAESKK